MDEVKSLSVAGATPRRSEPRRAGPRALCRPLGQLRAANAQEENVQTVWEQVAEEAEEGREEDQVDDAAFEQRASTGMHAGAGVCFAGSTTLRMHAPGNASRKTNALTNKTVDPAAASESKSQ